MKKAYLPPIQYKTHSVTDEHVVVADEEGGERRFPLADMLYFTSDEIGVAAGDKIDITPLKNTGGKEGVGMRCGVEGRRYVAVVNPNSGTKTSVKVWEGVQEVLEKNKIEGVKVYHTEKPLHAVEIAKEIAGEDVVLIAVGGDGILHEIVNGLDKSGKAYPTLAIIPAGTGNGLAATLGIRNIPDAVKVVLKGAPRALDGLRFVQPNPTDKKTGLPIVGEETQRVGFLHLTYGIIADIDFDSEWLRMLGAARFPVTAVGKILMFPRYRAKIVMEVVTPTGGTEEQTIEDDFLSIQLSNVPEISANMVTNPSASISDGLIDVGLIHWSKSTRYNAYQLFDLVENNPQSLLSVPWMSFCKAKKVTLTPLAPKPHQGKLDFDGEWMPYGEVTLTPLPANFKVLA